MKTTTQLILSFTLICLVALMPTIHAVVPPPDGGYPGGNTAEGQNALLNLTSGGFNTAIGWLSMRSDLTGSFNTAVGAGTLFRNNANENTAVGTAALLSNVDGYQNTATGAFALFSNTGSTANAERPNGDPGSFNTANGHQALFNNTIGNSNTAIGVRALVANTEGSGNTADGSYTLTNNTEGGFNTALGSGALGANTTGDFNIALGAFAGIGVTTADSVIAIGAAGQNVSNSCYIGQIYSNVQPQVGIDPDTVTITSAGRLGRGNISSRRYKHDIKPMHNASEAIYALKPVSFRYHKAYDKTQSVAFGLIAEEVAEVNPDLVGRNPEGLPESVRYEQINAMLLNEFLKAHKVIEEQQRTIAQLKEEMRTVITRLNVHESTIQAASDQIKINSSKVALATSDR